MTTEPATPAQRNRNCRMLVALALLFLGSFAVAGVLRFSGWRPDGMRNKGELLQPYGDLRDVTPRLSDGSDYPWNPVARRWRIAVAPPADCGQPCVALAGDLDKVWRLLGRHADHVDLLWLGDYPAPAARSEAVREVRADPAFRAGLPRNDDPRGVPVYVIDPNGFVILRYAPGTDLGDVRTDVSRLLKLR